jgi:hypothetical protein
VTFTAGTTAGTATLTATSGTATATASNAIRATPVRVSSVAYGLSGGRLYVTVTAVNALTGARVPGAAISLAIYHGTALYTSGSGTTGSTGQLTLLTSFKAPSGCYRTTLKSVSATGYAWDGVTPANQYCR